MMISQRETELILERALQGRGDFAELFFENTDEGQMNASGTDIVGLKTVKIYGAGLYLLSGTDSIYVYTNTVTFDSLMKLAESAANLLEAGESTKNHQEIGNVQRLQQSKFFAKPDGLILPPMRTGDELFDISVSRNNDFERKAEILRSAAQAGMSADKRVENLSIGLYDTDQRIRIANSEGLLIDDRRQYVRMRVNAVVRSDARNYARWNDIFKAGNFDDFAKSAQYEEFVREHIRRIVSSAKGKNIEKGIMPIVLEAGSGGTFFHECCGHMLEACAIVSKESPYADMQGKQVASSKLTLVDDGTVLGQLGTAKIDDEGQAKRRNTLIENGILKGFLTDRLYGRMLGTGSGGNGRRQNYTYAPTCRMSNTFVLEGKDEHEEIVKSVDKGILICGIGGGNGGAQFTISVEDAYMIEKGEITEPLKPFTITGNGIEMMKKIDRVGDTLGTFDGGFCGAASGLIPTTTNQPRVRIADLEIG